MRVGTAPSGSRSHIASAWPCCHARATSEPSFVSRVLRFLSQQGGGRKQHAQVLPLGTADSASPSTCTLHSSTTPQLRTVRQARPFPLMHAKRDPCKSSKTLCTWQQSCVVGLNFCSVQWHVHAGAPGVAAAAHALDCAAQPQHSKHGHASVPCWAAVACAACLQASGQPLGACSDRHGSAWRHQRRWAAAMEQDQAGGTGHSPRCIGLACMRCEGPEPGE